MLVDGVLDTPLAGVPDAVRELEREGYDAALSAETRHDPFLALALAAEHSERVQLRTSIAVAFARNPMSLAYVGHDLQTLSRGRFGLGLGSQVRAHVERRFSMPWSRPAARMREMILALRAIWACWNEGARLDFEGEFYRHTLMTPFFDPGPSGFGAPSVLLAAVGPRMTEVAGEVADGLLVHGFATERSLRELTLPALERGLRASGRTRADVEVSGPMFVVTGRDDEELERSVRTTREQIAFYASTPAYRPVLEVHGWGDLQAELTALSKEGAWADMGTRIDDAMLEAFAVVAEPDEVAGRLLARYGGLLDRLSFYAPGLADRTILRAVLEDLRESRAHHR